MSKTYEERHAEVDAPDRIARFRRYDWRNCPNGNDVLQLMREDDLLYNPWGTAMAWGFGVAEVLHAAGYSDEAHDMGYQPSPHVVFDSTVKPEGHPDDEVWDILHHCGECAPYEVDQEGLETCLRAAKILGRYIDWLKAAGWDY